VSDGMDEGRESVMVRRFEEEGERSGKKEYKSAITREAMEGIHILMA
jgi:hypothetical protein